MSQLTGLLVANKRHASNSKESMKAISSWLAWGVLVMALAFSSLCAAQTQGEESDNNRWFTVDSLNTGLGAPQRKRAG